MSWGKRKLGTKLDVRIFSDQREEISWCKIIIVTGAFLVLFFFFKTQSALSPLIIREMQIKIHSEATSLAYHIDENQNLENILG